MDEKKFIKLDNGVQLAYKIGGQGPVLLLIHGNRDSLENYISLFEKFSKSYTVICVDLRGHGDSDKPRNGYRFENLVADIQQFIEILKIKDFSLIGHSLGASIAMQLALEDQDNIINNIVLLGTSVDFKPVFRPDLINKENIEKTNLESSDFRHLIQEALRPYFIVEQYKHIETMVFQNWAEMPPFVHQALVMELKHPELENFLRKIDKKTLVIAGELDRITPLEDGKKVASLIPEAEFISVEGCGHFMYMEEPEFIYKAIQKFFDRFKKKSLPCHIEFKTQDFTKFESFYQSLGWKLIDRGMEHYKLIEFGEDASIGGAVLLKNVKQDALSSSPLVYIRVDDVDSTLKQLCESGAIVHTEKQIIPNVGEWASLYDLDNNFLGLWKAC